MANNITQTEREKKREEIKKLARVRLASGSSQKNTTSQSARDIAAQAQKTISVPAPAVVNKNADIAKYISTGANVENMSLADIRMAAKKAQEEQDKARSSVMTDNTAKAAKITAQGKAEKNMKSSTLSSVKAQKEAEKASTPVARGAEALSSIVKKTGASLGVIAKGGADTIVDAAINANNEEYQKAKKRREVLEDRLANTAYDVYTDEGIEAPGGEAVTTQAILRNAIEKAKEKEDNLKRETVIDENHWAMKLYESGIKDAEKAKEGLTDTQKQAFDIGMSIADNLTTLPTAMISPSLPLQLMAAKAAGGKTYELSKQGVAAKEAILRGAVSGGIEAMTEKIPLDEIVDAVKIGGKPFIKSVLKQMGTEASEESVSYMLNHIADVAAQDPNAQFSLKELAMSALSGAVSGGVMGGGATAIGNVGNIMRNNADARILQTADNNGIIEENEIQEADYAGKEINHYGRGEQRRENLVGEGEEQNYFKGRSSETERIATQDNGKTGLLTEHIARTSFGEKPKSDWKMEDVVVPYEETAAYRAQAKISEYRTPSFVISDNKWIAKYGDERIAFTSNGQVYMRENIPEEYRDMVAPHENTHVMKQVGYMPYLEFVENTPEMLDMSSDIAIDLIEGRAKHRNIDVFDMTDRERQILYDEINANMYGLIEANSDFIEYFRPAFKDFDSYADQLSDIHRKFKKSRGVSAQTAENTEAPAQGASYENIRELYRNKKTLDAEAQEVESNIVLTDIEQGVVRSMLAGNRKVWDMPQGANVDGIMAVYRAKKAAQDNDTEIGKHNSRIAAGRMQKAVKALENVDKWKDKKAGILYQRETMERNFRDIIPDKAEAEKIIAEYITPVHKGEANSNRLKNTMRKVIKDLNLSDKKNHYVEYMNGEDAMAGAVSESSLVQLLGEGKITDADVVKSGADLQKIKDAVSTFRSVYNGLIDQMNDVLVANGYAPVDYRKDYFPHFESEKADGIFMKAANILGFDLKTDNLPTDIAGRTHEFRPGKSWFRNALQRTGVRTEYDALKGFDMYIEGIANVIHHTENIRNIRALEDELRYETTDEATRKKVDEIRSREDIDELEKRRLMEEAYENGLDRTQMSNLAVELRRYGDHLANKKSVGDRDMEQKAGRIFYDLSKKLQGRVSSNMVAVNPASWLTNIIPVTQGMSMLSHGDAVMAMGQALKNAVKDDGFADRSTFLTNRRGSEVLVKTNLERAGDWAVSPMYYIDDFVANALVRGKYNENIRNGMDEMSAMDNADSFAASIMADRSKGALPSIFNEKNPVTKLFTTFQVEANNQLSYIVKDLPRMAEEEKKNLVWGITKMFVYGFLYNQIYEYFIGRRPALDPIDMAFSFVDDVADTETPLIDDITNLGKLAAEQTPFVGGLIDGGRFPISSAMPDFGKLGNALDSTVAPEKRKELALKEGGKVAAYFLMPFGGGQLKKTIEGVSAYAQGGSYTYDNEGNRKLNFHVEQTAGNAVRGAMFGQYAYDTAQEYVDSGFKGYSATETEIIDSAEEKGLSREKMISVINATKGMKTAEKQKYILELPWSKGDKQKLHNMLFDTKAIIDYTDENNFKITTAFESEDKRKFAQKAVLYGADVDKVLDFYDAQNAVKGLEYKGKTVTNSRRKAVEHLCEKYAKNEQQFIALMRLAGFPSYDSELYKMRKVPS